LFAKTFQKDVELNELSSIPLLRGESIPVVPPKLKANNVCFSVDFDDLNEREFD
jgi:hypothetical protein